MCIHCCRLSRTPCPPIPYSCPHCPVRTISSSCPVSRQYSSENPFLMARRLNLPSGPCDTLPQRWLEVNRRVIYALAKALDRSPEAAHYAVLLLLYANYGKVMMIARKRQSFQLPRSGCSEQDLFSTGGSLFNDAGFLTDPMAPETLGKLLRMLQDYISRLRQLNKRFKWYADGKDRGEILCLLGGQDELVRVLSALFGDSDAVPISQLLRAINDLDLNYLFGKLPTAKSPWPVKSISKLYSEVVDPYKYMKCLSGDSRAPANQIQEVKIQNVISPEAPKSRKKKRKRRIVKHRVDTSPQIHMPKNQELLALESVPKKPTPEYYPPEMPKLLYEPFDFRKSSTWRKRYSKSERVLEDGRLGQRRVQHYLEADKQRELDELKEGRRSVQDKGYADMYGTDMRRKSTRKSMYKRISSAVR